MKTPNRLWLGVFVMVRTRLAAQRPTAIDEPGGSDDPPGSCVPVDVPPEPADRSAGSAGRVLSGAAAQFLDDRRHALFQGQ